MSPPAAPVMVSTIPLLALISSSPSSPLRSRPPLPTHPGSHKYFASNLFPSLKISSGLVYLFLLAAASLSFILLLALTLPSLPSSNLSWPPNLEDVKALASGLSSHLDENLWHIALLFSSIYLFNQTFCIPTSVFMNILGGQLFGYWALPLVCLLTAIGSTCAYSISKTFGKELVERFASKKLEEIRTLVEKNRSNLFLLYLGMRAVPFSPNWLINLVSGHVGVGPVCIFFSSLLGLMPYNFVFIQAGQLLHQFSSTGEILDLTTLSRLAVLALLPLGILLAQKLRGKSSNQEQ